jgi:hypothetical protein
MSDLRAIFDACETDKGLLGFAPMYERHLNPVPRSLVEFGIAGGHSLRAWKKWGVERVEGVDVLLPPPIDGVTMHAGDQANPVIAGMIAGSCDAIIDDASHDPVRTWETFWLYRGHVAPGGWYVIENTLNMGTFVHDLLIADIQRRSLAELHIYPDILFVRMI